jgi:hypothetical protein
MKFLVDKGRIFTNIYYSFILDCTPDITHKEELRILLRAVDKFFKENQTSMSFSMHLPLQAKVLQKHCLIY